jgi:hypothetical protein
MGDNHLVQTGISDPLVFTNVLREFLLLQYSLFLTLRRKPYVLELAYHVPLQHHIGHWQSLNS